LAEEHLGPRAHARERLGGWEEGDLVDLALSGGVDQLGGVAEGAEERCEQHGALDVAVPDGRVAGTVGQVQLMKMLMSQNSDYWTNSRLGHRVAAEADPLAHLRSVALLLQ
jgi:hypothetical protein